MLKEDIRNIKSEISDLKKFGLTVGIVIGILGSVLLWREKEYYIYFLIISAFLIIAGLLVPAILRPLQKAWMGIAVTIGWFMTRVILSLLFFLVFTPIGLIGRLFGQDFIDRKFRIDADSYWIAKDNKDKEKSRYEKHY